jgi:methylglutaconyl-CoA hydratase
MRQAGEASFEENLADAHHLANMLRLLAELPKPTIARVHGAALGGGMGLAAACDICIAAMGASFATSEVQFGIVPSAIGPYVLRAIGPRQAARYFLTAERIDARQARDLGLAHDAVEEDQLDKVVAEVVGALLRGGPGAQSAAKALIRDFFGKTIDVALVAESARRIADLRMQAEAQEGLSAFLEKRPAHWAG